MTIRAAVLFLSLALSQSSMAAEIASSSFDADAEGWTLAGDGINLTWQSTGGDPDGYINAVDASQGSMWLFKAPAAYTGDQSAAYSGTLSYSLRLSSNNGWNPNGGDVFLVGNGGVRLAADSGPVPGTSWATYSVVLDASGGWRHNDLNGALATDQEILDVLASLTSLEIRGEYTTGADNADLDTVVLESAATGSARFMVTKTYSDGNDDEIEVTLTCNSGLPLKQSFTIAGGDPAGVTFVVQDIPDSGANCEVTETGNADGYTPYMNAGAGCVWEGVSVGLFTCDITNVLDPVTFTVNLEYAFDPDVGDFDSSVRFDYYCENVRLGPDEPLQSTSGSFYLYAGGNALLAILGPNYTTPASRCRLDTTPSVSALEMDGGCNDWTYFYPGDEEVSCTATATVFFEGIPTLSQWSLAILAVLTLGAGLIGFRRFT